MTISEQIREAALYADSPYTAVPFEAFHECLAFKRLYENMDDASDTDLRTFMLLVAEALE